MQTFEVKGMSCSHCVASVTRAVTELDADARVEVDLAGGKVAVQSTATPQAIAAAIEDAGYEVQQSGA